MGAGSAGPGGAHPAGSGSAESAAAPSASLAPGSVADANAERIGVVAHYYDHVGACVVAVQSGRLAVGDSIHIRGHTTDYYQRVERLERDHQSVHEARPGDEVGLQVGQRVREHDVVYKLKKS